MKTVGEILKNPFRDSRRIGIEIEVERADLKYPPLAWWNIKNDDSLRDGGREFVTDQLRYKDIPEASAEFYKIFDSYNLVGNQRTGTHVHIDCRDLTLNELQSVILTYCYVEPALMHHVGKARAESIYCVPWYIADDEVILAKRLLHHKDLIKFFRGIQSACKYSALYLEPLVRFGTIEFRHAPTWTTKTQLISWVTMCYKLVEWGKHHSTEQIVKLYQTTDNATEFTQKVLGFPEDLILPTNYNDLVESCDVEILAETIANTQPEMDWITPHVKPNYPVNLTTKDSTIEPNEIIDEYLDEQMEDYYDAQLEG